MEISQKLPQFREKKVMIIVTGRQEAEVYRAGDGAIERMDSVEIAKPKYSDKESFFGVSGKEGFSKSGSGDIPLKEKLFLDFNRDFKDLMKRVMAGESDYSDLYLFSPAYMKNVVSKIIPAKLKKKIKFSFEGDYYNAHPFRFLEKIKKELEGKRVVIQKEEASKIIKKSKIAREIIKGNPNK